MKKALVIIGVLALFAVGLTIYNKYTETVINQTATSTSQAGPKVHHAAGSFSVQVEK